MILKRKEDYYCALSDKLNDPHTSAKSYWSILKTLCKGKKIPLMPPILISNKLVSNFKEKANHFSAFFASQCTPVSSHNTLPLVTTPITNASLSSISFNDQEILNIIPSLNFNKAHGYGLSIRLLKICDSSVVKPLSTIFKNCLQSGSFPNNWKKSNVVPIHKKGDKQLLQNYGPVSLLPICKIFEIIIFSPIFEYLKKKKKIVFSVQINLVFVHLTHVKTNYYQLFIILHEGLLFKLEHIGISGNLLSLLKSFLSNRFQ